MKLKAFIIISIIGAFMFACSDDTGAPAKTASVEISGKIQGGYRHLPIDLKSEMTKLVVYRGDYVKFYLNDGGDPQVEYELWIPELEVKAVLKDDSAEQPYFKMKTSGSFQFKIGEHAGQIEVIELRQANYRELTADEGFEMLQNNPPLLLDVRTPGEFHRGYIKDAVLIPLQEIQRRAGELEQYQNQPILIYCATGNRSTTASKILLDKGFKNVMNLRMGIMDWARRGYEIQYK